MRLEFVQVIKDLSDDARVLNRGDDFDRSAAGTSPAHLLRTGGLR